MHDTLTYYFIPTNLRVVYLQKGKWAIWHGLLILTRSDWHRGLGVWRWIQPGIASVAWRFLKTGQRRWRFHRFPTGGQVDTPRGGSHWRQRSPKKRHFGGRWNCSTGHIKMGTLAEGCWRTKILPWEHWRNGLMDPGMDVPKSSRNIAKTD